ncbi:hypothetical protein MKK70_30175 [Methylobacterium sp. E-041]|jgi:transposase|uniref:hypothetical protein n=1 Tax=unclassified Methylobacterium TaxID=2615210 RepID=UPI001FBB8A99|nr:MULTISPECIES: hypothetical protein [unclassified Methylobacterium]MCJ2008511.1 hypothetical protein [Methylobacterium sp. J-092]MCJ2042291.1 hypothetical protein [Methylobacterium sp. J-059]MCJ2075932.1 hypothetical protein [Methylobacterium sp. E-016]MCJ2109556.1 hypothetical protein [Methylobacterium sp. E-041]MCJ2113722.1 hypothetical protein [Methylobacterium sp. E-025]
MPQLHPAAQAAPTHDLFADHLTQRARNRLHAEPPPTRIIEVGEIAAGIAVPEPGGVRFFSSARAFDELDGTVFRSTEQAARAARERFRARTRVSGARPGGGRPAAV